MSSPTEQKAGADLESVGMLSVFAGACLVPVIATLTDHASFGLIPSVGLVGATSAILLLLRELGTWARRRTRKE